LHGEFTEMKKKHRCRSKDEKPVVWIGVDGRRGYGCLSKKVAKKRVRILSKMLKLSRGRIPVYDARLYKIL